MAWFRKRRVGRLHISYARTLVIDESNAGKVGRKQCSKANATSVVVSEAA